MNETAQLIPLSRSGFRVGRFYLFATEAGRTLYLSLGFQVIADLSAWVLGHSTRVNG